MNGFIGQFLHGVFRATELDDERHLYPLRGIWGGEAVVMINL